MERKKTTLYVVMLAMMMALCCVLTVFVQIPMGNGYVNFGDAVIFLAASLLGPGRRRDRGRNRLGSCRHFQRIRGLRRVHARGKSRRRFRVRLGVQTPFSHSKTGRSPYYFDGSRFAVRYRGLLFHRLDSVRNSGGCLSLLSSLIQVSVSMAIASSFFRAFPNCSTPNRKVRSSET